MTRYEIAEWYGRSFLALTPFDKPFFKAIGGPHEKASQDIDSGDVIWLVPELSDEHKLKKAHWEVLTLEESTDKLLSARAIQRSDFECLLSEKLKLGGEWK